MFMMEESTFNLESFDHSSLRMQYHFLEWQSESMGLKLPIGIYCADPGDTGTASLSLLMRHLAFEMEPGQYIAS